MSKIELLEVLALMDLFSNSFVWDNEKLTEKNSARLQISTISL